MPVKINGSTSGSVTLAAPASGSDVTLTLPTLGFGKVLQVVMGSTSTSVTNTSDTYADTGLSASITPSSTSSKILVLVAQNGVQKLSGNANSGMYVRLLRGSTTLVQMAAGAMYTGVSELIQGETISTVYLDSPATTTSTTYKTTFCNNVNASGVVVQINSVLSTIILVEVAP